VLSTQIGYQFWVGNNPYTFSHYPYESIDRSVEAAFEAFHPHGNAEMEALGVNEATIDQWFFRKALEYIHEHPWLTLGNSFRKIAASFGWLPSPRKSFWPNLVHALAYGFVIVLGLWGMWMGRRHWREHIVFYVLFLSFVGVAALFYGHTSHRAYLDVYLIVFAAGVLEQFRSRCLCSVDFRLVSFSVRGRCRERSHSMVIGRRLTSPKRCSTAASIKSRTSSPLTPLVVARKLKASRSQQSSAKATRTRSLVVAADLKAIGAPAAVARIDGDASVMSPLDAASMAIKQQAVDLHHPVNARSQSTH
jgi:hypothetical protein